MILLTDHSVQRGRERLNLNRSSLQRLAETASEKGMTHAQASGRLKRYLDRLFLSHGNANNLRIYGRHVFLFAGSTLLTVHLVPNELTKFLTK